MTLLSIREEKSGFRLSSALDANIFMRGHFPDCSQVLLCNLPYIYIHDKSLLTIVIVKISIPKVKNTVLKNLLIFDEKIPSTK